MPSSSTNRHVGSTEPTMGVEEIRRMLPDYLDACVMACASLDHKRLAEADIHEIVERTRIRFAGFTPEGRPLADPAQDLLLLNALESQFVGPIHAAQHSASIPRDDFRRDLQTKLTPEMRSFVEIFSQEGGHVSVYSTEQQEYILKHGLIAFIELLIRDDVAVTIGSVSALTRNPDSSKGPLRAPFPQFDANDIPLPDPDDRSLLSEKMRTSLLVVRSDVIPSTDHPFIASQIPENEIPDHLKGRKLQRDGLAARAKLLLCRIAEAFSATGVTSNIGRVKFGDEIGRANHPSTALNAWMGHLAERSTFRIPIDPLVSRLRVSLDAYYGKIQHGIQALSQIVLRKGHSQESLDQEFERWLSVIRRSIDEGLHAPWGEL